jgi:hypothetical protein
VLQVIVAKEDRGLTRMTASMPTASVPDWALPAGILRLWLWQQEQSLNNLAKYRIRGIIAADSILDHSKTGPANALISKPPLDRDDHQPCSPAARIIESAR